MKNIIVILLLALTTLSAKAIDLPNIIVHGEKSFILDLNDWKSKSIEVSIFDNLGRIVHSDNITADYSKLKQYNMKELPSGLYNVKIEDDLKEVVYSILVKSNSISLMTDKKLSYKPVITTQKDHIDINILALNKTVLVELMDIEGNNLFSETSKDKAKFARRLVISELPSGDYTLLVKFDGELYTHSIYK